MAKVPLTSLGSRYGSVDALNANFDSIEEGFDNTLSRDGTSPNAMLAPLDMNAHPILNASTVNAGSLVLGGVTIVPTSSVSTAAMQVFEFTATNGQTTYSISPLTPTTAFIWFEVNGLVLRPSSLSISTSTLTFPALKAGDEVCVRILVV